MKIIISFILIATIALSALFYIKGKMNNVKDDEMRILGQMEQTTEQSNGKTDGQQDDQKTEEEQKAVSYNLNDLPQAQSEVVEQAKPMENLSTENTLENVKDESKKTEEVKLTESQSANSTEVEIDIEGLKKILKVVRQYDVINLLRIQNKLQTTDKTKNIVISDYFIVLSPNEVINSNKYQTIIIAPVLSKTNYEKSSQKTSFVKANLKSGEELYVIPSSMRAVPKLSIAKYYGSVTEKSIEDIKKESKNLI